MKNEAKEETIGSAKILINFGEAIEAVKLGKMITRLGWNGSGMFVFRQVPAQVPAEFIPKMSSLPETVKAEFLERGKDISYSNQFALVKPDNVINSWAPSVSDTLSEDWIIL